MDNLQDVKKIVNNRECRTMSTPLALVNTDRTKRIDTAHYVEGYATTFDKPYVLFEENTYRVVEIIDRNALVGADMRDVIMRYDHKGKVLARLSNGTLGMEADNIGLFVYADLSKSRAAQEVYEEIGAGLITQMSWNFSVLEDKWEESSINRVNS